MKEQYPRSRGVKDHPSHGSCHVVNLGAEYDDEQRRFMMYMSRCVSEWRSRHLLPHGSMPRWDVVLAMAKAFGYTNDSVPADPPTKVSNDDHSESPDDQRERPQERRREPTAGRHRTNAGKHYKSKHQPDGLPRKRRPPAEPARPRSPADG